MTPRWIVERKRANWEELLQVVEIYAEGENLEVVKKENREWTYERELVLVQSCNKGGLKEL